MKAAVTVLKEQIKYFYLVKRLSFYELKSTNSNNYLGMFWELLNPAIQIAIYWFVFGFGILRDKRGQIGDIDYFPWLLGGIVVWFFINQGLLKSSKSIYTKIKMLSKMNFPMSVIPNYVIFANFYSHLMLLGFIILILQFLGFSIFSMGIYYLQLPIYMFGVVALIFAISLITSTLATIIRDVQMLLQSVLRMLLYLSPILWDVSGLPHWVQTVMKINPFYYIVEGYRHSLVTGGWYFIEEWQYTLYFFGLLLLLFVIGGALHVKFRRHFVDFL
ncbi:ABC transporter permease [Thalassobacillus devorans]|uniref:ABC transporter permease n=1 Tax=Thalassobacillus devorans TaxID=279813 RepID=UPI00049058B1|nr:ABC transporter permease [Thalassobacillus devorans]